MNEKIVLNPNAVVAKIHNLGIQEVYIPGIKIEDVVKRGLFEFKSAVTGTW